MNKSTQNSHSVQFNSVNSRHFTLYGKDPKILETKLQQSDEPL